MTKYIKIEFTIEGNEWEHAPLIEILHILKRAYKYKLTILNTLEELKEE